MKVYSNYQVNGDVINLKTSRNNHISDIDKTQMKGDKITESFKDLFAKSLENVNDLELKSTDMSNQMTIDPDSVNIHDVMIAAEQAEMAVLLTKDIVDKVIRAYKEITNVR